MYYLPLSRGGRFPSAQGPKSKENSRKHKIRKGFRLFVPKSTSKHIKVSKGVSLVESKSLPLHSLTGHFLQRRRIAAVGDIVSTST